MVEPDLSSIATANKREYVLNWISAWNSEEEAFWIDCSNDTQEIESVCNTLVQSDSGIDIVPDHNRTLVPDHNRTRWTKLKM